MILVFTFPLRASFYLHVFMAFVVRTFEAMDCIALILMTAFIPQLGNDWGFPTILPPSHKVLSWTIWFLPSQMPFPVPESRLPKEILSLHHLAHDPSVFPRAFWSLTR